MRPSWMLVFLLVSSCGPDAPEPALLSGQLTAPQPQWRHRLPRRNLLDHGHAMAADGSLLLVEWTLGVEPPGLLWRARLDPLSGELEPTDWFDDPDNGYAEHLSNADVNGDGVQDVVYWFERGGQRHVWALDAATAIRFEVLDFEISATVDPDAWSWIVPGQADADPGREWSAMPGVLFDDDGTILAELSHTAAASVGPPIDLSGDGLPDFITVDGEIWDGRTMLPLMDLSLPPGAEVDYGWAYEVIDADGDGGQDLLFGGRDVDGRWSLYDEGSLTPRWSMHVQHALVPQVLDLDLDGSDEIAFITPHLPELVVTVDPQTGVVGAPIGLPSASFEPAGSLAFDVDLDGVRELVVPSWFGDAVYQPGTGWIGAEPAFWDRYLLMQVADIGAGPQVFLATRPENTDVIPFSDYLRLDPATGEVADWETGPLASDRRSGFGGLDEDGDGVDELAIASGNGVVVIDTPGAALGTSRLVQVYADQILAADVDGDGREDMVTESRGSQVAMVRAGESTPRWSASVDADGIGIVDIDGNGRDEILLLITNPPALPSRLVLVDGRFGTRIADLTGGWDHLAINRLGTAIYLGTEVDPRLLHVDRLTRGAAGWRVEQSWDIATADPISRFAQAAGHLFIRTMSGVSVTEELSGLTTFLGGYSFPALEIPHGYVLMHNFDVVGFPE